MQESRYVVKHFVKNLANDIQFAKAFLPITSDDYMSTSIGRPCWVDISF